MKYHQINRQFMEHLGAIESELHHFHAFRHLWAELVANHKSCGIPENTLQAKQCHHFEMFIGMVEGLRKDLGITYSRDSAELKSLLDKIASLEALLAKQAETRAFCIEQVRRIAYYENNEQRIDDAPRSIAFGLLNELTGVDS